MNKFFIATLIACSLTTIVQAQNRKLQVPHELSIGFGTASYFGDLNNGASNIEFSHNIGFGLKYHGTKHWTIGPKINFFRVSGSDIKSDRPERNLSFQSDNVLINLHFTYNFNEYSTRESSRKPFEPYLTTGFGFLFTNPKANYEGKWYELQPLQTEGKNYSNTVFNIPLGIGAHINLSSSTHIGFEFTYLFTFSDYLDDVSSSYIDNRSLTGKAKTLADRTYEGGYTPTETNDGITWAEGSQRGSGGSFDSILLTEIFLNIDLVKPRMRSPMY